MIPMATLSWTMRINWVSADTIESGATKEKEDECYVGLRTEGARRDAFFGRFR
jgi:hypothetical protein